MMRTLIPLLLFTCMIAACKKDHVAAKNYIGKWELRSASGMMGVQQYPSGNGNLLIFTRDSLFEYYQGNLISQDSYRMVQDSLTQFGEPRLVDKLIMNPGSLREWKIFMEIKENTLTRFYGTLTADRGSSSYIRIADNP